MNAVWNRALALSLLTVGAVGGMSGVAWATPSPPTPIAIVNPSFEADTTPNGSSGSQDYWYYGSFTGWTFNGVGGGGWYHPSTLEYPGGGNSSTAATGIPDGSQVAFLQGGAGLKQILTTNLVSNAAYTLTFYVGQRADVALPANYSVELLAGSSVLASAADPVNPAAGTFGLGSLTFTSQFFDPHAGLPLAIVLSMGGGSGFVNFDNLGLSVVTDANIFVPEPSGVALLAVGLIAVFFSSRRGSGRI